MSDDINNVVTSDEAESVEAKVTITQVLQQMVSDIQTNTQAIEDLQKQINGTSESKTDSLSTKVDNIYDKLLDDGENITKIISTDGTKINWPTLKESEQDQYALSRYWGGTGSRTIFSTSKESYKVESEKVIDSLFRVFNVTYNYTKSKANSYDGRFYYKSAGASDMYTVTTAAHSNINKNTYKNYYFRLPEFFGTPYDELSQSKAPSGYTAVDYHNGDGEYVCLGILGYDIDGNNVSSVNVFASRITTMVLHSGEKAWYETLGYMQLKNPTSSTCVINGITIRYLCVKKSTLADITIPTDLDNTTQEEETTN